MGSGPAKVSSYAKIAAMPAPNTNQSPVNTRKDIRSATSATAEKAPPIPSIDRPGEHNTVPPPKNIHYAAIDSIPVSVDKLALGDGPPDSSNSEPNADSADSYEEDQSQISSSSLNKPQSFDTKSMASVTTFAMDDKESIRPDDSASVRAVDDEHPHPSLSRNSSFQHENEPQSHRSSRVFPSNMTVAGRRFPTLANLPRFGNLPVSPVLESQDVQMPQPPTQIISPDDPRDPSSTVIAPPDEKLMDALASAKDRLPLLQIEEKVLAFLANSAPPVLELPPQNSFTRLLTHKLADYYNLPHAVNEDNTSVRIFRSGPRAAPTPLAQLARSVPLGSASIPTAAAVKIMRREQLGSRQMSAGNSTAPSSSVASKTTSENGADGPSDDGLTSPAESTPNRDKMKMTREEREAQYKAARDRIFADFQESVTSETNSTEDQSASMSRSSSSSGKKKTRRNKARDDSFEARSAFALTYTPTHPQYNNGNYMDPSIMGVYPVSSSYEQNMYGVTPTQSFPGFDANMQYAQMQGFNGAMMQHLSPNDWQTMQNMQMQESYFMYQQQMPFPPTQNMGMQGHNMPSQVPEWYPNQAQAFLTSGYPALASPFQQQHMPDQRYATQNENFGQPYPRVFTQQTPLTAQYGVRNQKSLFNPQTRSFIPSGSEGRPGSRSTRTKNGGRNSMNPNASAPTSTTSAGGSSREESLKLKYGTPPSLPKKPPPPSDSKYLSEVVEGPTATQPELQASS